MLARLVGAFIVILVGVSMIGTISQEINNAINCGNMTSKMDNITNISYESPPGQTGSFGGAGGDYHFGGYNGEVKHEVFGSNYAIIKSNQSLINPLCKPINESTKSLLAIVPAFFGIAILIAGVFITFSAIKDVGLV